MKTLTQRLLEEFETLPNSLQQEALHYIEYLQTKVASRQAEAPKQDGEPNGAKLARLMEEIARRGTAFQEITDPAAWQREIRKDRPLPGRE